MRPMTPLLWIASAIWMIAGSFLLSWLFCGSTTPTKAALSITDGDAFKASSMATYAFPRSSDQLSTTAKETREVFQQLGQYLNIHPQRALLLTGMYNSGETNSTSFDNLGIARAESIKQMLLKKGADLNQISVAGTEVQKLSFVDKKLYGGVNFTFSDLPKVESNNAAEPTVTGINVFFKGNATKYEMDDKMEEHIAYLQSYLKDHPDAVITVYGHTDNQGDAKVKRKIAKDRATKIRRLLRDFGDGNVFKSKQVKWKAVGPDEPIGSNETEDGIALNNRVTIVVK